MFKSCKLIPVMLVGVVFLGKKYTWLDYLAMLSLTCGMVIFSVGDSLLNTTFSTPGGFPMPRFWRTCFCFLFSSFPRFTGVFFF